MKDTYRIALQALLGLSFDAGLAASTLEREDRLDVDVQRLSAYLEDLRIIAEAEREEAL